MDSKDLIFGEFNIDIEIECRCGWAGKRGHLLLDTDIEVTHPRNKDLYRDDPKFYDKVHYTRFEKCPKCKRCLYADGKRI